MLRDRQGLESMPSQISTAHGMQLLEQKAVSGAIFFSALPLTKWFDW
jgi:hypothetical protein